MKIGIVTTWFERGAAYVSKQYIDALKDCNEIFIYARGGEQFADKDIVWSKYNVTWGDKKWGKDYSEETRVKNLEHFKKWLTDQKLDVVFFNEEHWWESVMLCNELGIKVGSYVDYYTEETNPFFKLFDFLICNTKRHLSAFKWHDQTYYIPWGTDINIFKPNLSSLPTGQAGPQNPSLPQNSSLQACLPTRQGGSPSLLNPSLRGRSDSSCHCEGFLARGNPVSVTFFHSAGMNPLRKGTDILIRAFSKLNNKNAKLIIHAQKPLKTFFPKQSGIISKLEEAGKLSCIEKTVGAPGLYYMGDVYVYPTILEGIGLTIAEALSSGLPVITSDNAPMNEFVNDKNGKLVKIKRFYKRDDDYYWPMCEVDEESLISSMEYYCKNFEALPKLKKYAREYAENNLDWKKNSLPLNDIFSNAKIVPLTAKDEIKKIVVEYEKIKRSKIRRFFHKIKILKWRFIPFVFKKIWKELLK